MLNSIDYRKFRSKKSHLTSDESKVGHHGSTEEIAKGN